HPDPLRQCVDPDDREREPVHPDAEADWDRGRGDLAAELLPPAQAAEVVDGPDGGRHRGAEEQPAGLPRQVEERESGYEDAEEERQAAESGHSAVVEPAALGLVDHTEEPGHAADGRRQQHHDRGGEQRAPDDLEIVGERFKHQWSTSASTIATTIRPKNTVATIVPRRAQRSQSSSGSTSLQRCQRRARSLLRTVETVSRISEAWDDEAAVVQAAVDRGHDDLDV